eukprot:2570656-Ditylum_brightwellii.AAC.1
MGGSQSSSLKSDKSSPKKNDFITGIRKFGKTAKENIDHELARKMMIQREVQMAVNIARARDNIQIF